MLYAFYGTNILKSSDKARKLRDSLLTKKPDASYIEINTDNWNPMIIEEHIGGQGLFSNKYIIFLDRLFEEEEMKEKVLEMSPLMKESENIFISCEGKINAESAKVFEKHSDKVVVTDEQVVTSSRKDFNIFSLADALGSRDHFKAWSIYCQAIQKGLEPESILGTLFWQLKAMILALDSRSAAESGLNPFVFSKAKRFSANYSSQELKDLLQKLIILYHDAHRGLVNPEWGIEKFLLKM